VDGVGGLLDVAVELGGRWKVVSLKGNGAGPLVEPADH
jgi:hypothetical protein